MTLLNRKTLSREQENILKLSGDIKALLRRRINCISEDLRKLKRIEQKLLRTPQDIYCYYVALALWKGELITEDKNKVVTT